MLIIVEGCDGAGKSTFVDTIASMLDQPEIRHFGPPKRAAITEYEVSLQDYVPGSGKHIICDRFHAGEMIYGPLYRGRSALGEAGYAHVQAWLRRLGAVMCWLNPPLWLLKSNLESRGDDYINFGDVEKIIAGYGRLIEADRLPRHVLDRYPDRADAISLIRLAHRTEREAAALAPLRSYVGWPFPEVLFVGDKQSAMAGEHRQAFVPWPGRSGEFLMEAIAEADFRIWGALNSAEDDVKLAVSILGPLKIVALGREAHRRLQDIVHVEVPHPAAARRFMGLTSSQYGTMLEACCG